MPQTSTNELEGINKAQTAGEKRPSGDEDC